MQGAPGRGLPPRVYVPILILTALAFLALIGYFLKIGLGVTGAALGPEAQSANAVATLAPGESDIPQTGGGPMGVGGGTPVPQNAGGPPPPVARLLVELRGRVQKDPRDLEALVSLASMYFDAGKYAQSAGYFERALAVDPSNPDTRTNYAMSLYEQHENAKALAQLQAVLAKRPSFPEALYDAGVVADASGKRAESAADYKKFLDVAPSDQRADAVRAALRKAGA